MRWLSLLSRVAFICNLAFLTCLLVQWQGNFFESELVSTLIITGFILAPFIFSPLVSVLYVVALVRNKTLLQTVPRWLRIINFTFLVVETLFVLFFLHDPFYT